MTSWFFKRKAVLTVPVTIPPQHLETLRREYERKLASAQRSPLDESAWVRKFTVLDADYSKLAKENDALRAENARIKRKLVEWFS